MECKIYGLYWDKKSETMMLLRGIKVGIRYIKEKKRNGRSQKNKKKERYMFQFIKQFTNSYILVSNRTYWLLPHSFLNSFPNRSTNNRRQKNTTTMSGNRVNILTYPDVLENSRMKLHWWLLTMKIIAVTYSVFLPFESRIALCKPACHRAAITNKIWKCPCMFMMQSCWFRVINA